MFNARAIPSELTVLVRPAAIKRTLHQNAKFTRPRQSELPPQSQPTRVSEDGTKTLRLRQNGNHALPLPPFMDPLAREAKERYRTPKPDPQGLSQDDLQRQLAANPYAQALATPVRHCSVTRARLPAHFLLSFSTTVSDPAGLAQAELDSQLSKSRSNKPKAILVPHSASTARQQGTSSYVLNRNSLIEHLNGKKRWTMAVTLRMSEAWAKKTGKTRVRADEDWIWDPRMPDRILQQLRNEVIEALRAALDAPGESLVRPMKDLAPKLDFPVAAILCCEKDGFPAVHSINGLAVPVYHLGDILRAEPSASFPDLEPHLLSLDLAIRDERRTCKLLLALHRLHMYSKT